MLIYLASRYSRRKEMLNCAKIIEFRANHTITARWLNGSHKADTPAELAEKAAMFAQEDIDDIKRSDVLIAFTESPDVVGGASRGGRHVELGLAIALNKRIVVIGHRENVFCHLPEVMHYQNWEMFKTKWLAESMKYGSQTAVFSE